MVMLRALDLHWNVRMVPRDRVRRELHNISSVRSCIDVSDLRWLFKS